MCGIAGIFNLEAQLPPGLDQITAMASIFRYRGPNESGAYLDDDVALGHVRLSIIGIDGGIQPICNETETLWIVYNGEAFNYLELKDQLLARGHRFTTETDTEVVLHLYEEYGPRCLDMINGQFALAIWDSTRRELFLARDRVGIRPLYYTCSKGRLLFASEIKSILTVDGTRQLDMQGLAQVFTFWTTLPGKTVFEGIHELPPGHFMGARDGKLSTERFWSIPFHSSPTAMTREKAAEELRELLTDAVRLRLRADVPVGSYLSGGLDSSIISMLIAKNFNNRLKTFSIGFQEDAFDESDYQEELIRYLGADHRRIMIDNGDIRRLFPKTIWHCEKPLLRTAPVPLLVLSGLVQSEGFRVVLSGEGADEVFGGYNIFREAKVRRFWGRDVTSEHRPLLLERLYPYIFRNPSRGRQFLQSFFRVSTEDLENPLFSHMIRWEASMKNLMFLSDECRSALAGYNPIDDLLCRLPEDFFERDVVGKAQFLETEIFLSNYLLSSQGDRVGMANSVELRHPFLDFRVIDFAYRLPSHWKIRGLDEKNILKKAFRGMIPERIGRRPKKPYRAPIRELFFADAPTDYVDDQLSAAALQKSGYFNPTKAGLLFRKFRNSHHDFSNEFQSMALIGILSTQLVHQQFVEGVSLRAVEQIRVQRVVSRGSLGLRDPAPGCTTERQHAVTF
ncbi:asparagine synthase (glutamine-hydrolyzing) [Geobacter sp. DSM 9736]|uniref:asparagine synthase (glutamine-hydrolyzing) n=1 Tax=Geobacter sp. DSM 9736 TaxID=1277350 RepID=UPI000B50A3EB|nr:asparagine synthase (glutamine-hydrolyzing) [Geobacter sp. DSM 9736]SNB46034.1 asparagine synthase (glutamine-hydrolysing) [Geobacter sp. DSM 9736]